MKYSGLLKTVKKLFYSNKVLECGSDARDLYRLVNNLMGKSDVPTLPKFWIGVFRRNSVAISLPKHAIITPLLRNRRWIPKL